MTVGCSCSRTLAASIGRVSNSATAAPVLAAPKRCAGLLCAMQHVAQERLVAPVLPSATARSAKTALDASWIFFVCSFLVSERVNFQGYHPPGYPTRHPICCFCSARFSSGLLKRPQEAGHVLGCSPCASYPGITKAVKALARWRSSAFSGSDRHKGRYSSAEPLCIPPARMHCSIAASVAW